MSTKQTGSEAGRPHWALGCLGTLAAGITLPVLLTCHYNAWRWEGPRSQMAAHRIASDLPSLSEALAQFLGLELVALLLCGPGAVLLSIILYWILKNAAVRERLPLEALAKRGLGWGAVLAFANLPGYLSGFIIGWDQPWTELRVAGLFIVAGAASGLWVSWQAWRAAHPEARFFPQYSLKTLLLVVILAGCVMLLYAPPIQAPCPPALTGTRPAA